MRMLRIRGGTVVTAADRFTADVYVRGEQIVGIGTELDVQVEEEIDATGCYLFPGGVDPHVHLDFPSLDTYTADDAHSGTSAAAQGGTTTIINFAVQQKGEQLVEALHRSLAIAEGKAVTDYSFHVVVRDLPDRHLDEIDDLMKEGVSSVKVFMAYPGEFMIDDGTLLRILEKTGEAGGLTMVHAENGSAIDVLTSRAVASGRTSPRWHAKTRPALLEAEAVHRASVLAQLTESPAYFVHLSCEEAVAELVRARSNGVSVFGETCPHYLTLDDRVYDDDSFEVARYVMTPPLRAVHQPASLWRGIDRGDVDVVSTDHCPFCMVGQKDAGRDNFLKIPNGVGGVEYRLPLLYDRGVAAGRITLERLVAITASNPAKLFGLYPKKGTIAVGADADIVIFDPKGTTTLTTRDSASKVDYSIYEGWEVQGRIRRVLVRGTEVVSEGRVTTPRAIGRFIPRGPSLRPA